MRVSGTQRGGGSSISRDLNGQKNDRTTKLFLFSYFFIGTKTKTNGRNTSLELSVIQKRSKIINSSRKDKIFVVSTNT
jgi:hypothetical protein